MFFVIATNVLSKRIQFENSAIVGLYLSKFMFPVPTVQVPQIPGTSMMVVGIKHHEEDIRVRSRGIESV